MTAPAPTARQSPAGIKLKDGYSAKITFAVDPDISFWEKTVKPPGMDGGDKIEQTTMHNVRWRTSAPRSLVTLTESNTKVAYDPAVYTQILAILNVETTITVLMSDGSTLAYFGFLKSFEPDDFSEGEQPEATINIEPTNFDPAGKVEAGPFLTNVSGT